MITQEELKKHLKYDPDSGKFLRLTGKDKGKIAGGDSLNGYINIGVCGQTYLAHRLVWLYVFGRWPKEWIDHINGVGSDNRLANLRESSISQNMQNTKRRKDNASGAKGVSWHRKNENWRVRIKVSGKYLSVGSFSDFDAAKTAYEAAAKKYYGEFARIA